MLSRVLVGRDVDVVRQADEDVELVGKVRLRPGFVIEIVPGAGDRSMQGRTALVCSWRIRVLGRFGPIYRGVCRWCPTMLGGKSARTSALADSPHKTTEHPTGTGLDAPRVGRGARR